MRTHWKMALLTTALALGAVTANARSWQSGSLSVEVLSARSAPFEQFPADGSTRDTYRAYLQAERGAAYRVRVRNRSGRRVGLVIAVDGRNIVSGERSDLKRSEAMYVLEPWAEAEYAGWRSNLSSINEFYFTDWRDSYAEAIGDRSARGVIAVAAFPEQMQYRPQPRYRQDYGSNDKPAAPSAGTSTDASATRSKSSANEAGTGYGERRWDPAQRVQFVAQREASARVFLKYEWPETLCQRGISCQRQRPVRNRLWNEEDYGFVPPPPRKQW